MKLLEYLSLGIDLLATKARDGTLAAAEIWLALKGAKRYRDAMKSGDVAPDAVAGVRAGMMCAQCEHKRERDTGLEREGGLVIAGSCGELLDDRMAEQTPTCGCLVYVKINGRILPAGKTWVGSESCPQGKW